MKKDWKTDWKNVFEIYERFQNQNKINYLFPMLQ